MHDFIFSSIAGLGAITRALIRELNIQIFVFCARLTFFKIKYILTGIKRNLSGRTRRYVYSLPPPPPPPIGLFVIASHMNTAKRH